jgi:hypothetical protein
MSNRTTPATNPVPISLVPQTGMPQVYQHRSKEIIYDALQDNPKFIKNPFGPQLLPLSRPNHHW